MSVQSRAILKTFFEAGDTPTEQQFIDLLDSLLHVQDPIAAGGGGTMATQAEAQAGVEQSKYMSPFLTELAIGALVRLSNISALETEVDNKDTAIVALLRGGIAGSMDNLEKLRSALAILIGQKEPAFTKGTAFNGNFGETHFDVARGGRSILQGIFRINSHTTVSMGNTWVGSATVFSFISVMHVPGSYFRYRINHNYGDANYLAFFNGKYLNDFVFVKITDQNANYIEFDVSVRDSSFTVFSPTGTIDIDFQLLEMNNF